MKINNKRSKEQLSQVGALENMRNSLHAMKAARLLCAAFQDHLSNSVYKNRGQKVFRCCEIDSKNNY